MSNDVSVEIEVLRRLASRTWEWFEETVADVTSEQANWWPPGTANSIGTNYLHVVINADVETNRLVVRKSPLIEHEWDGNVGQGVPYDPENFDRWTRHVDVDWPRLREYGRAVHRDFLASLDTLTDTDLDIDVDMTRSGLGMWKGRDLIELHGIGHPRIHGGEIGCLKGLQGGVGYRESDAFRAAARVEDHADPA